MSLLQDESFPCDDFFNYSIINTQHCINYTEEVQDEEDHEHHEHHHHHHLHHLHHHHHRQSVEQYDEHKAVIACTSNNTSSNNISSSNNSNEQNLSSSNDSSNGGRPSSVHSNKTTRSEPMTTLEKDAAACNTKPKSAFSYQNIHSEYTKRRYKHVESKVSQYIASIKAAENKRHQRSGAKFLRHRSMPDTLGSDGDGDTFSGTTAAKGTVSTEASSLRSPMHFSEADLHTMTTMESLCDTTIATTSKSTTPDEQTHRQQCVCRHSVTVTDGIDAHVVTIGVLNQKLVYLLDENDRLQSRLEGKMDEIMRRKRNEDYLRTELINLQDKLKEQKQKEQKLQATIMDNKLRYFGNSYQTHVNVFRNKALATVAIQTDMPPALPPTPPPPPPPTSSEQQQQQSLVICLTPSTPDVNNNNNNKTAKDDNNNYAYDMGITSTATTATFATDTGACVGLCGVIDSENGRNSKNIATIQPVSLNFSHDDDRQSANVCRGPLLRHNSRLTVKPSYSGNSSTNYPASTSTSGDSAIDIEAVQTSPDPDHVLYNSHCYNEGNIQLKNQSKRKSIKKFTSTTTATSTASSSSSSSSRRRYRWLRLFGACARCNKYNNNQTKFDCTNNSNNSDHSGVSSRSSSNSVVEHSYTHIPLLEKSYGNHCRNMR